MSIFNKIAIKIGNRINKGLKIIEPENNKFLQKEQLEQINKEREKNQENIEHFIEINSSKEQTKESQGFPWKSSAILNNSKEILKENSLISNKNAILEEWLVNSLENYQEKQHKSNKNSKDLLNEDENNEKFEEKMVLEDWMINSLNTYQEKELEINKSSKKSLANKQNNKNNQVFTEIFCENKREIDKLLSKNSYKDLLKQRKTAKKENLLKYLTNLFEEMKISLDFFCDSEMIDNLRRTVVKIEKIKQDF